MQTVAWSIETLGSIMKSRLIDVEEAEPSIIAAAGGEGQQIVNHC